MMHGVRALLGALLFTPAALAAQEPLRLTLKDAVARAQERGPLAVAARESRDAARARDRAFGASLLPQASLTGTAPAFNRSIIPVLQPDGSTLYRAQEQNESNVNVAINQRIPILGGDLFINSALSRLDVVGNTSTRTWSATPMTPRPPPLIEAIALSKRFGAVQALDGVSVRFEPAAFTPCSARTAPARARSSNA